jgi:hypothetical protein
MFKTAASRIADASLDPIAVARSARDHTLDEVDDLVRRADVPGHVDAAMDAASGAVRGFIRRLPGQRQSRSRTPLVLAGLLVVGIVAGAGLTAWLVRRSARNAAVTAIVGEDQLDREALDRASDEGMSAAPGTEDVLPGSNGAVRDLPAIGELV